MAVLSLLALASLGLSQCGGGETHEKIMKDMISVMNRMGDTLSGIKDKASAEAAKGKLTALVDEMKAVKARMDKIGEPTGKLSADLKAKYEKEMMAAVGKMSQGMIKAMAADEKVGMVLFYAAQPVTPKPSIKPALVAKGKEHYGKTCFRCHGEDGHGAEKFARIAGQQPEYLTATLKRYRVGQGVRTDPLMAANTKLMTDADIEAVVAYVMTMP